MPAYEVHAFTQCAHSRIAKIEVSAPDAQDARVKASAELVRMGRQPEFLTLVPVEVGAPVNPFRC
ncbi:hypothetical protein [Paraburkholderia sp. BCC1885]|uniref:hypothetical protein n=1 Tax=Paraburkholderia sp. BCC1885 TaxID=2562669 RepID=UPI0011845542|nr:hypothetical protein [Paraburkholderia sp. BCC1885]